MIWEIYQTHQIGQARNAAQSASRKANSVANRVSRCEDKIDSLALVCQAMWELLGEHIPDCENVLRAKIEEIDLRDGKKDGKMGRISKKCSQCDRPLHARHRSCLYCGAVAANENILHK